MQIRLANFEEKPMPTSRTASFLTLLTIGGWSLSACGGIGQSPRAALPAAAAPRRPPAECFFSVQAHGAAGDGRTKDTPAIQQTIDTAHEAGGGTVYFPAGTYLSGTLYLKSHVTLRLEAGATLLGSTDLADYPCVDAGFRSYTDKYVCQSLLSAENVEDFAVVGEGVIDGQGAAFSAEPRPGFRQRPYLIRFVTCRNILIEGITLRNTGMWTQHYLACDNLTIRGITVLAHCNHHNDMMVIDGCHNVWVSDCYADTLDDGITLKSTSDRLCENVTITNCVVNSRCNGIKLGTETNGGFRNIAITNCALPRIRLGGIALMIVDGGTLDGVTISNITMASVGSPIFLRLGNRARPFKPDMPAPGIGIVRNIVISNVIATATATTGCYIAGLPGHDIENVTLSNIKVLFPGGGPKELAWREIPETPESYPECTIFGNLPAYGFYGRHVNGLTLHNIDLRWATTEARPALICDDVRNLQVHGLTAQTMADGAPMVILDNVHDALFWGCRPLTNASAFLRLQGGSRAATVTSCDLSRAATPFEFDDTTPRTALYQAANRVKE